MKCLYCDHEIKDGAAFCPYCGQKVQAEARKCGNCGQALRAGDTFCPACGTPVMQQPAAEVPVKKIPAADCIDRWLSRLPGNLLPRGQVVGQQFLTFNGRLNRQRFILRKILYNIISTILLFGGVILLTGFCNLYHVERFIDPSILQWGYIFVLMLPLEFYDLSLMMRRCHDLNRDGRICLPLYLLAVFCSNFGQHFHWFWLAGLSSLVVIGIVLWLMIERGTHGSNSYGADLCRYAYSRMA